MGNRTSTTTVSETGTVTTSTTSVVPGYVPFDVKVRQVESARRRRRILLFLVFIVVVFLILLLLSVTNTIPWWMIFINVFVCIVLGYIGFRIFYT